MQPLFSFRKQRPQLDVVDGSSAVDPKREISLAETMAPRDAELATARTVIRDGAAAEAPADGEVGKDISLIRTQAAAIEAARAAARSIDPGEAISLARTIASTGQGDDGEAALSREELGLVRTMLGQSGNQGITDDPELARRVLEPAGDDRRLKDLIRARLFRSKAAPVKIGRYTILDRLGEGGMGVVYTAYDDQLDRKIAIKVMRSEAEEGSVGRARLIREAQAMARLAHPNIVTVHEAAEVDGQVFVAMEFVRGQSLDQWLKEPHPWREVLDVFVQAGRGLEAAHRQGLVHRDFKPHNVLLGRDGAVKVLDFGLARAIDDGEAPSEALVPTPGSAVKLLDARLTRTGAVMGTPAYMAPEQHQGLSADARSDQFAFAVALFEGLHGQHPFDCSTLSSLLGDVMGGKVREPANAGKVPAWVRRVVARGMSVEPAQRFGSMGEMLMALSRDPLALRRRRMATAGIAGFVGALGFGAASLASNGAAVCAGAAAELAGVWDDGARAAVEKGLAATGVAYAGETWAHVQPRLDAYAKEWAAMRTEACESHRAGTHSDRLFDLRTACLDQRRASLGALAEVLASADAATVEKAVIAAANLPSLTSCADTEALTAAVPPPEDPKVAARVKAIRVELAKVKALTDAGKYADGLAQVGPLRAEAESLKYEPLIAEAALREGSLEMERGEVAAAEASLSAAISRGIAGKADEAALEAISKRIFLRAAGKGEPASAKADAEFGGDFLARVHADASAAWLYYNNVGVMHEFAGDVAGAEAAYGAFQARDDAAEVSDVQRAVMLSNVGNLRMRVASDPGHAVGPYSEALHLMQASLGAHHPYTAMIACNLGTASLYRGSHASARVAIESAIGRVEGTPGLESICVPERGLLELEMRRYSAAVETFEPLLAASRGAEGELSPAAAWILIPLADAHAGLGEWEVAEELHRRSIDLLAGTDGVHLATAHESLGRTFCLKGEFATCLSEYQQALGIVESKLPPGTPSIALSLDGVGRALTGLGRFDEAEAALRRALAISEEGLAKESPQIARVRRSLGELALARGDAAAAAEHLQRSVDVFAMVRDAEDGEMAAARLLLARALAGRPGAQVAEQEAALTLGRDALRVLEGEGEGWAREREAAKTWLSGQK